VVTPATIVATKGTITYLIQIAIQESPMAPATARVRCQFAAIRTPRIEAAS
jgi:hypothetical protein